MKPLQTYVIRSLFEQNQMSADRLIRGLSFIPGDLLDQILTKLVDDTETDKEEKEESEKEPDEGYYVHLLRCKTGSKVHAMSTLKEFLGIGLKEAKDLVDSCPVVIRYDSKADKKPSRRWFTRDEAQDLAVRLIDTDREIEVSVKRSSELPV